MDYVDLFDRLPLAIHVTEKFSLSRIGLLFLVSFLALNASAASVCGRVHRQQQFLKHLAEIAASRELHLSMPQYKGPARTVLIKDARFETNRTLDEEGERYEISVVGINPRSQISEKIARVVIRYFGDGRTRAKLGFAETSESFRGNDLSSLLFYQALKDNPSITSIYTGLSMTNLSVFANTLRDSLSSHPQFRRVDGLLFERDIEMLQACCDMIPKGDYQDLVVKAIQQTPSFKARAKIGFTRFLNIHFDISGGRDYLTYEVARQP